MAQNAPPTQDVQDVQFKLHDEFTIFEEGKDVKSLINLLAVSSAKGLLFAGNPNNKEMKVFKLRDLVDAKQTSQDLNVRVVNLPGEPKVLACSCDGSMLAVNYVHNNTGVLQIYQVDSFIKPNLHCLYNLPVAPESNVFASQLLWNPVVANNIALILTDGSVAMFTLNNAGQYDKVTLGKEHQVKSGCWSPKGKQIVLGFAEGKLQQFKPNLQPARAIPCPPGIHPGPFDCIAVHWLSTYQFATIFLQRGQDMCPSLFIVNAPKTGQPSYINYYDVCYSAPGPRAQQLLFTHISQWNLLLVVSANGVEIGVLGTRESGDTPSWVQYTLLDEARIEMPLTESKDETYPLGFVYDTASAHQVVVGEKKMPVMPMIHVLSTHGHLISYNFLNLSTNAVGVCSPPTPLNDVSGQFRSLSETVSTPNASIESQTKSTEIVVDGANNKSQAIVQNFGDTTFSVGSNIITSTPAVKDKPVPILGSQAVTSKTTEGFNFSANSTVTSVPVTHTTTTSKPSTGFGFGSLNAASLTAAPFPQTFGSNITTGTTFNSFAGTGSTAKLGDSTTNQPTIQSAHSNKNPEVNKPLYTVPPTFTPPTVQQTIKPESNLVKSTSTNKMNLNTVEIDEVVKQMIVIQIKAFETEINQIKKQSKDLMEIIGSPDEIKSYSKQLNDLQEIIEQAEDHEFEQDVQSLRHSMNESYAMLTECRTKLDLYNNPSLIRLSAVSSGDPISRRQLAKLQAYIASNKNQLSHLNQLVDAQWSQYQDVVRRNSKNQMHVPCLDGIYQRMSKLKDLLLRQRTKMNFIKTKLKQKGLNYNPPSEADITSVAVDALTKNQSTMESLADSILSMSLSQVVSQTHAKLSEEKLNSIRNFTKRQQQISIIKPKRPDRISLRSEVILETKLETERKQKEMIKKQHQQNNFQLEKPHQSQVQQQLLKPHAKASTSQQQQQLILAKPTASKLSIASSQPSSFITPTSSTSATLSFGGNSSFVKTAMTSKSEEFSKLSTTSTPFTGLSFPQTNSTLTAIPATESKENAFSTNNPISFSAKVIGGNDGKPFLNSNNKAATQIVKQSFAAPTSINQGFSAFASATPNNQDKDDNNKLEEKVSVSSASSISTSVPSSFGGFRTTAKSDNSSVITTTSSLFSLPFGSATNAPASTTSSSLFFNVSTVTSGPSSIFGGLGATTKPTTSSVDPIFFNASFGSKTSSAASTTTLSFPSSTSTVTTVTSTTVSSPSAGFTATAKSSSPIATTSDTSVSTMPFAGFSSPSSLSGSSTASISTVNTSTITPQSSADTITTTTESMVVKTPKNISSSTTGTLGSTSTQSFNIANDGNATTISTKSLAESNATITSSGLSEPKLGSPAPASSNNESTDSLFGSLNICKPTTKEAGDSTKTENVFAGFGPTTSSGTFAFISAVGAGDGEKSFLASTTASGSNTPNTTFSFTSTFSNAGNIFGKSTTVGTGTATDTISATSTTTTTITAAPSTTGSATMAGTSSSAFGTSSSASTANSLFGSLSLSTTSAASTKVTVSTTTTTATGSIFGGGSLVFGQAPIVTTSNSIFGGGAAVASSAPSLFGSTAPSTATVTTSGSGSIFGSGATISQPGGSVFSGMPKPDQSIFGSNTTAQPTGTDLFGGAATTTKSSAATGGSIFSGSSSNSFGNSSAGSLFRGGNTSSGPFGVAATASTASSIFGGATAAIAPAEGDNIFRSPVQQSASGGSLFNKSTFSGTVTSTGGIFGGSSSQPATSGGFGTSGGSIFGSSVFGAGGAATTPAFGGTTGSSGFGSFSQPSTGNAFGSPSTGGFASSASTAFGSPQQQSAFAKPVFGGPATFGSPQPAFGAQPTFGGAPTFGSPKGFGSFAISSTSSVFGSAAQGSAASKGNIFETLGSQDTGLSFGNLAHSAQAPQQKPTFGGSSFMNYRS